MNDEWRMQNGIERSWQWSVISWQKEKAKETKRLKDEETGDSVQQEKAKVET